MNQWRRRSLQHKLSALFNTPTPRKRVRSVHVFLSFPLLSSSLFTCTPSFVIISHPREIVFQLAPFVCALFVTLSSRPPNLFPVALALSHPLVSQDLFFHSLPAICFMLWLVYIRTRIYEVPSFPFRAFSHEISMFVFCPPTHLPQGRFSLRFVFRHTSPLLRPILKPALQGTPSS